MAEKKPRKPRTTPEGEALLKEMLERKDLIEGTEAGYRELAEGKVSRWERKKGNAPGV